MDHGSIAMQGGDLTTPMSARFYGKYRGVVTNVDDPEQIGRILALAPEALGVAETSWAMPCTPYPGIGEGWFVIPAVGASVWIEFEAGDPTRPIWTGGWFGPGDVPRDHAGIGANPRLKVLRTNAGLILALDDDGNTITLSDGNGDNLLEIQANEGQIRLRAGTRVTIEAPQIELGDGVPHPLVFGDDLLQYVNQLVTLFNAHLHPGQTVLGLSVTPAPPVPPLPPPSPSILSQTVKTA